MLSIFCIIFSASDPGLLKTRQSHRFVVVVILILKVQTTIPLISDVAPNPTICLV